MRGWLPSSTKNELASKPSAAPVSAVTMSSTISASIAPFVPPIGSMLPSRPAAGLVVGWPSRSSAHPSGIALPSRAATMSLPRATSDSDRSIVTAGPLRRGNVAAIGFVPKSARLPPAAGIAAGELPMAKPTIAAAATGARWSAATPK